MKKSKKVVETRKNNLMSKDIIKKMKENDKIFEEKMSTLKQRKIKVIKPVKRKETRSQPKSRVKEPPKLSINKGDRFNLDSKEPPELYINKGDRFNFIHFKYFPNQNCTLNIGQRFAILSNIQNYYLRNKFSILDNNIVLTYLAQKSKNEIDEEQDLYFISKIRELQNDIKYKTDLIIDLQNKLKHQDGEFIKAKKLEIEEMNNKIKKILKEKDEKMREIQRLETENYNQKRIIENFENKMKNVKNNSEIKKEEIENLTDRIDQLKIENDEKQEEINRLQTLNKNHIKDYELLKTSFNKIKNDKKYLETIIEDQKLKMENNRKHINALRKFIVEDNEGNKLNSKINENNKIISYNNKILNSRNKINLDNDDFIYNTINIENNINTLNNNDKAYNTINAGNSTSNKNDIFYKKVNALSFKSTPNINKLSKNKSHIKKTNVPPRNNDSLFKNKSTRNMNAHNNNPKLNKSSNLDNKNVKIKENKKNEEKVKQKEKKVIKTEKKDDQKYKKDQNNKYKKNIEDNSNKNKNNKDDNIRNRDDNEDYKKDINDNDEGEDNENNEDDDIDEENEEYEGEEEDDISNEDDNDENINDSNKLNDNNEKNIKYIKKNIRDNINNNKDTITSYQYTKKHHNRNNSDLSDKAIRNAKYKYDSQNNFNEKFPRKNKRERTISSLKKKINRNRIDDDDYYNDPYYQTFNNFNEIKYISNSPRIENTGNYFENDLTYFPSEKYLVGRKDEIETYEAELDLLLKEKNNLESELIKMPEHPRTLREIKIKRALNERLNVNENNINKVKRKLRLMKEA